MRNRREITCRNCAQKAVVREPDAVFCSRSCSAKYNNTRRKHSETTKVKIRESIERFIVSTGRTLRKNKVKKVREMRFPIPDREWFPEEHKLYYHRAYERHYTKVRREMIEILGGKCSGCGTTEGLKIKYTDLSKRTIKKGQIHGVNREKRMQELKHCKLICPECNRPSKKRHGTVSAARYCKPRCDLCRVACSKANRAWNERTQYNERRRQERAVARAQRIAAQPQKTSVPKQRRMIARMPIQRPMLALPAPKKVDRIEEMKRLIALRRANRT